MFYTLKKLIKIINFTKLSNIYFLIILIFLNSLFEILSIGTLIPLVSLILNPDLYIDFKNFISKFSIFEQMKIDEMPKKEFILLSIIISLSLFSFKFLINIFYSWFLNSTKIKYEDTLGFKILKNFSTTSNFDVIQFPTSKLMYDLSNRVTMVSNAILNLSNIIVELIVFLILNLFLFFKFPSETIMIFIFLSLSSIIFYLSWKRKISTWSNERGMGGNNRNKNLYDFFEGFREIIIYSSHGYFLKSFKKNNFKYLNPQKKILFLNSLPKLVLEVLLILIILTVLYYNVQKENNLKELIVGIGVVVILMIRLLPSINRLIYNFNHFKFSSESIIEVFKMIKLSNKKDNFDNIIDFKKDIVLENINFKFSENKTLFKDLSLKIIKNSHLAIIGKTGSGKSTLIDIILGLLKPQKGNLFIDSKSIEDNTRSWIKHVSFVPQKIFLFNGSLRHNITFKDDDEKIDDKKFREILDICELNSFIVNKSKKEFFYITEDGTNVSGGQRQKIGIARALYKDNSSFLILDESTNALDEINEQKVLKNLIELKNKTIFFCNS